MAVGAALASMAVNWPLVSSVNSKVHDTYDTLFTAWILDWVQHAVGSSAPLWDANIFVPNPRTLAYSDAMVGLAVVLLPARWLGLTAVGVHNVGLLLAYASSMVAGYVFARIVTGRQVVAVVTGVAFAFGPANTFLAQHLNIALHPAPALAAAAVWCLAERRARDRSTLLALAALVATLALQSTVSFNTLAITLVAVVAVAVARWRDLGLGGLAQTGATTAASLVVALPFAWPYIQNRSDDTGPLSFDLADFSSTSANFLTVDPSLALWGDALASPTGLFGQQPTFPGAVLLVLGLYGLLLWRRALDRRPHVVAVTLLVVGFVLSIGTSDSGWARFAPYRLVVEFVPGGTALRATGRFWLVGLLGLGLLAGLAVQHLVGLLTANGGRRRRGLAIAVVAASVLGILGEGLSSWDGAEDRRVPAVDRALARLEQDGGVVYLPLPRSGSLLDLIPQAAVVHGTTAHHRPTPNGYASYYPESFLSLGRELADLPGERALGRLRELDVRYVVVGARSDLAGALNPGAAERLRLLGDYDGTRLYEVPEPGTR